MFDLGWSELLVIGVVALIVIGPKDLPGMFRQVGKFTARARAMASEFKTSLEAAADEAGVKDLGADLKKVASVKNLGLDTIKDFGADLGGDFSISDFESPVSPTKKPGADAVKKPQQKGKVSRSKKTAPKAKSKSTAAPKKAAASKSAPKKSPPKKAAPKKPVAKKPAAKKPATSAAKKPKAKA